jgi:two-component system LytT family response regulator
MKAIIIDDNPKRKEILRKMIHDHCPQIQVITTAIEAMTSSSRLSFSGKLSIPVKEGILNCAVADVIRIESDGSYSTVYVVGGKRYVISKGLKEYEELLPEKEFFRVHKSHLINIHKIRKYVRNDGNFLEMADGFLIEVARRKKSVFLQVMNTLV